MPTLQQTFARIAIMSLTALSLLTGSSLGFASRPAHAAPAAASDAQTAAFLTKINAYRQQNGLGALAIDQKLQAAADWMSADNLARCVDTKDTSPRCSGGNHHPNVHDDSLGRDIPTRLQAFGYPVATTYTAENAVQGWGGYAETADLAFTWWQNSHDHNLNMLGANFKAIGIARSCNAVGCAWVTNFGSQVVQAGGTGGASKPAVKIRTDGAYIKWIQQSLNQLAGADLAVDGINGPLTKAAVKAFQTSHGLQVDGIVGPQTEAALIAAGASQPPAVGTGTVKVRTDAAYIKWVQQSLNQVANAGLAVDGINGPLTKAAVKAFQTSHGLVVDGIVGPQTEGALIAAGAAPPPTQ